MATEHDAARRGSGGTPGARPRDLAWPFRILVGALFLAVILLTIAQVFFRLLDRPLIWSEELVRLLIVWVTFLGAAIVIWDDTHLHVDVVLTRLPSAARRMVRFFNLCLGLIFLAGFGWYSIDLVKIGALSEMSALSIAGHRLTEPWSYLPATIGAVAMMAFMVARWLLHRPNPNNPDEI